MLWLVAGLAGWLVAGVASAQMVFDVAADFSTIEDDELLFYDDFEAYPVGSFPGNGWQMVYSGAGDQFQRVESGTAASGTNSLRLVGVSV